MAKTNIYLNFPRQTEEAFLFYQSVFGGEFTGGISRMGDMAGEGMPELSDEDKKLVMHVELPLLGGVSLMGTDAPESMGFSVNIGNNLYISLEPDTLAEAQRIYDGLSAGGQATQPLKKEFWGAYYGSCTDKFGIQWMFNCYAE
jgi:PhnB protein